MTVISHSHHTSTRLARSREQDSVATSSVTSGVKVHFVTLLQVVGLFYMAPNPLNSTVLIACGDLFYPFQPSAVLQCP
jgi:hypothetical protein